MPHDLRSLPLSTLALAVAIALLALPAPALATPPQPRVAARAALLMDVATSKVLWQRNGHRPVRVASTTKMLTALVAEEVYPQDKVFVVPEAAVRVDGTRLGYTVGMRVRRDDLLTTLLLMSANDAAETLAAAYPRGGRAGFIARMQAKADSLGCTDSTWRDPSGLDAPGHYASAADLAVIGKALLARPLLAKIVAARHVTYRWPDGRSMVIGNHNKFVRQGRDPGAIGIKTGYTSKSGHTLVAAQRQDGRTLIAVALDSPDMYADVRAMFAYGFALRSAPAGAEVLGVPPATATQPAPGSAGAPGQAGASAQGGPQAAATAGSGFVEHPLAAAGGAVLFIIVGLALIVLGYRQAPPRQAPSTPPPPAGKRADRAAPPWPSPPRGP